MSTLNSLLCSRDDAPIMHLIITASDQVLARYGNQLAALGEGKARKALSRALNHEGDKGPDTGQAHPRQADRNQVRRGQQGDGYDPGQARDPDLHAQGAR